MAVYTEDVANPNIAFLIDTIRKSAIVANDIAALVSCDYDGTTMSVDFGADTLSAGDQTILAGLIAGCSGVDRDLCIASDRIWFDYLRRKNSAASASFSNPYDFETRFCNTLNASNDDGTGIPIFRWGAITSGTLARYEAMGTTIRCSTSANSGGSLVSRAVPCPTVGSELGFSMRVQPRMVTSRTIATYVGLHDTITASAPGLATNSIFIKFSTTSTEAKCQAFIHSASQIYTTSELLLAGNEFNHVGLGYVGGVLTLYVYSPTTFERRSSALTQALPASMSSAIAITSTSPQATAGAALFGLAEFRYYVTNVANASL